MTDADKKPSCTWEEATYRSATDREFRKSLLEHPTRTLRGLGLLGPDQTAVTLEWKPQEVVLMVPPLKGSLHQQQEHAAELRKKHGSSDHEAPASDQLREPASKTPPSDVLQGPAIASIAVTPSVSERQ